MHSINKNYFNWFQLFDCVFANYSIKIANGWRATSVENKSVYFPPPELQASNASQYDRVVSNDGSRPIFGTTCDCHFMLRWKTKSFLMAPLSMASAAFQSRRSNAYWLLSTFECVRVLVFVKAVCLLVCVHKYMCVGRYVNELSEWM